MTFFGNRIFADETKDLEVRSCWVGPDPMTRVLVRQARRHRLRRRPWELEAESTVRWPQPEDCWSPQERGGGRWDPPEGLRGGGVALARPDFRLLASRSTR